MVYKRKEINNVEDLKTLRLSPSSINSFNQCPRRWFFDYIEHRPTKASIHLARGSAIHKALEELFFIKQIPSGEEFRNTLQERGRNLLKTAWKENVDVVELKKDEKDLFYEQTSKMLTRFVDRFCNNIQDGIKMKKFGSERQGFYYTKPIFRELWLDDQFETDWMGKPLLDDKSEKIPRKDALFVGGFIDSVQKDFDNNINLIDYKTSNKWKNTFPKEYMLQLAIYAYLWETTRGSMPTYVGINFLKYDESYYMFVTPSLIKEAIYEIKKIRNSLIDFGMDKEKYFKKETKLCDWCSHKCVCLGKCEDDGKEKD